MMIKFYIKSKVIKIFTEQDSDKDKKINKDFMKIYKKIKQE